MQVTVHQAKTQLSRLIEAALRGEEVVISRGKTPVVRLEALPVKSFRIGTQIESLAPPADELWDPLSDQDLEDWQ